MVILVVLIKMLMKMLFDILCIMSLNFTVSYLFGPDDKQK